MKSASYSVQMPAGNLSVLAYEPSKCFVATVCCGGDSNEVLVLKNWRDNSLIHNKNGRKLIIWYYNNGEHYRALSAIRRLLRVSYVSVLSY